VSISTPSARPTPTLTIVLTFCAPALPEPTIASTPKVPASTSPAEVTVVPEADGQPADRGEERIHEGHRGRPERGPVGPRGA